MFNTPTTTTTSRLKRGELVFIFKRWVGSVHRVPLLLVIIKGVQSIAKVYWPYPRGKLTWLSPEAIKEFAKTNLFRLLSGKVNWGGETLQTGEMPRRWTTHTQGRAINDTWALRLHDSTLDSYCVTDLQNVDGIYECKQQLTPPKTIKGICKIYFTFLGLLA